MEKIPHTPNVIVLIHLKFMVSVSVTVSAESIGQLEFRFRYRAEIKVVVSVVHYCVMSDEYRCFKDNPLPMYELVLHANCTVAHILEPQTFSNLHSAESEQLDWRKTGP